MQVSVEPFGRTVEAREGDNLLTVLREREVPVSYSCMAGRCGTCTCKVLEGRLAVHGDTSREVISVEAGQSVLACQAHLVGDCRIEIPNADDIVVHPARIIKSTVTSIEDLTHDIKRITLALAKPLQFSPGQYATLQFAPGLVRPYSMAVTESASELEFHIRAVPGGKVTTYVNTVLKVGDAVRLSGPLGTAYLRKNSPAPVICIAGGTGLAPVLSVLRGMDEAGMENPVHVYFGARTSSDIYGIEWLNEIQARRPQMSTNVVVSQRQDGESWRAGIVTHAVDEDWQALTGWRAYLAGAPAMVEAANELLVRKGIDPGQIHADAFYAT
ncbi:naphthalene 1,2-dioxygenase [Burkholderia cenocepacia]|nr:naphthalene 1,2-dioxygenase [Burkholderia cenocepacia]